MGKKHVITRFLLTIVAVVVLLPMVVTVIYAFCAPGEVTDFMDTRNNYDNDEWMEIKLAPKSFSLSQFYRVMVEDPTVLRLFCNSAIYTVAILIGQGLVIPAMAYALSRFRFPFRDTIFFACCQRDSSSTTFSKNKSYIVRK